MESTTPLERAEARVRRCDWCGAWTLPRPGQSARSACTAHTLQDTQVPA